NIAIITSYNDMLSAHQPYEHYPEIIRKALHSANAGDLARGGGGQCFPQRSIRMDKGRARQLYAEGKVDRMALLESEAASYHAPG
ncbi:hypothetical protein PUR47_30960, partial [Klebsiella pneumoniae]|uniref:hypothetical protein n=1 Tax=Klebsiella pneumoniae TaxID=573 RepID=UPI0023F814E3|nr:hypothetical protein [Klebsiella pneumoniae]